LASVLAAFSAGTAWCAQPGADPGTGADPGAGANEPGSPLKKATVVETLRATATVTAIDPDTRKITLTMKDGQQTKFKAGPDVRNFDQIHVGDQVVVTAAQAVALSLRPPGTPPNAEETAAVAVAPEGAKPGVLMAETSEVTAKITALDPQRHTATLKFEDGTTQKVKCGKDVNFSNVKVGDDVTGRVTDALLIKVERPQ
jgi:hypothetical protein